MADPQRDSAGIFPTEEEGWNYSQFLPMRVRSDANGEGLLGTAELAWPGMIRHAAPFEGANILARAQQGQSPGLGEMNALATNIALGGLGASSVLHPPSGAIGMFAGAKARSADLAARDDTMFNMAVGTEDRTKAFQDSNWFKGPDGEWRFELPDDKARLRPEENGGLANLIGGNVGIDKGSTTLVQVLHHPELFKAYPHLQSMPVSFLDNRIASGRYIPKTKEIELADLAPDEALSTLLHETQHAIQHYEGFAPGGSRSQFLPQDFHAQYTKAANDFNDVVRQLKTRGVDIDEFAEALHAHQQDNLTAPQLQLLRTHADLTKAFIDKANVYNGLENKNQTAWEAYRNLAGESEARNTEERRSWNWLDRKRTPPWKTTGIPPEKHQIVLPAMPYWSQK